MIQLFFAEVQNRSQNVPQFRLMFPSELSTYSAVCGDGGRTGASQGGVCPASHAARQADAGERGWGRHRPASVRWRHRAGERGRRTGDGLPHPAGPQQVTGLNHSNDNNEDDNNNKNNILFLFKTCEAGKFTATRDVTCVIAGKLRFVS